MKPARLSTGAAAAVAWMAGCFFAPGYAGYPRCENAPCPEGSRCLSSEGVCVPECGEESGCETPAKPDGGPSPIRVSTASLPAALVCVAYASTLQASGGVPPYQWGLDSGALPPGVVLSNQGALSGSPTSQGSFAFTVRVSDSATPSGSASAGLSILVGAGSLTVTSQSPLPPGRVGVPYRVQLQAAGGVPTSFRWSLCAGELPAGLSLTADGEVGGTPAVAGTRNVMVAVADGQGGSGARALSLTVQP